MIDRTEVILDIFATRARTHEAHLAVELAQLEYSLPRLKRMWTHLSRYKGGIGVRGPGEKQLEEDRRLVTKRIRDLKEKLSKVEGRREREVAGRGDVATVGLVGYTNAGKSTLMNALTDAGVLAEDKLFATLDTRTKRGGSEGGVTSCSRTRSASSATCRTRWSRRSRRRSKRPARPTCSCTSPTPPAPRRSRRSRPSTPFWKSWDWPITRRSWS